MLTTVIKNTLNPEKNGSGSEYDVPRSFNASGKLFTINDLKKQFGNPTLEDIYKFSEDYFKQNGKGFFSGGNELYFELRNMALYLQEQPRKILRNQIERASKQNRLESVDDLLFKQEDSPLIITIEDEQGYSKFAAYSGVSLEECKNLAVDGGSIFYERAVVECTSEAFPGFRFYGEEFNKNKHLD